MAEDSLSREIAKQEELLRNRDRSKTLSVKILDEVQNVEDISEKEAEDDSNLLDIIQFVRSPIGLNESPYPIQRFLMRVMTGSPLEPYGDSYVSKVVSAKEVILRTIGGLDKKFGHIRFSGDPKKYRVAEIDVETRKVTVQEPFEDSIEVGQEVFFDIPIPDKFREELMGVFTEIEFFEFLRKPTFDSVEPRISITLESYNRRCLEKKTFSQVILRIGRRGTKTTITQWLVAYFMYRLMRLGNPQSHYQMRQDQPISVTLIATSEDQAISLLAPARSAIKRSPYLARFVTGDRDAAIELNTPHNVEVGLGPESGIKITAAPCSAKAARGPANFAVLLEEFGLFYSTITDSNNSDRAIYEAVAPSLSDLQNPHTGEPAGTLFIVSTPLSDVSYMYELESLIWNSPATLESMLVLHLPSYWTNRLLPSAKLREQYFISPTSFSLEYEARYTTQGNTKFTKDAMQGVILPPESGDIAVSPIERCYMGLDLGLVNDPSSVTVVAKAVGGKTRIVHHETFHCSTHPEMILDGSVDLYEGDSESALEVDISEVQSENQRTRKVLDIRKVAREVDRIWKLWGCEAGLGDQWNSHGIKSHLQSGARNKLIFLELGDIHNSRIAYNFIAAVESNQIEIYASISDFEEEGTLLRELIKLRMFVTKGIPPKIRLVAPVGKGHHDDQYSSLSRAVFLANKSIELKPGASSTEDERQRLLRLQQQQMSDARRRLNQVGTRVGTRPPNPLRHRRK